MSKIWFITGCSSGFGKEIARYALEQGDAVIATARNPNKINLEDNENLLKLALDVTHKESINNAVKQSIDWKGKIDVLVNNAGFGNVGSIEETPDEQWQQLYAVNLFGLLDVTKAVLHHMKKQKSGHIINISSVGGLLSMPGLGPYCSTKFAVEGMSEALAQEVASLGIKVSIIEPGAFRTDFMNNVVKADYAPEYSQTVGQMDEMVEGLKTQAPGDPYKAAKVIFDITELDNPPLRLLLGKDAYGWALEKIENMLSDIKSNEELTKSTDFD